MYDDPRFLDLLCLRAAMTVGHRLSLVALLISSVGLAGCAAGACEPAGLLVDEASRLANVSVDRLGVGGEQRRAGPRDLPGGWGVRGL